MSRKQKSCLKLSNKCEIQKSVSLANFTTWRVGGKAEWFAEPSNVNEIESLISWGVKRHLPIHIIGAGSNLLIHDSGIKGLVICLKKFHGYKLELSTGVVEAISGENIPSLSRKVAKAGLHGLEWAVGIPGTIGGAIVMNAGAQGGCISKSLESIKVLPINGEKAFEIKNKELCYGYRESRLQHDKLIVLSAKFILEPDHDPKKILHQTNLNLHHRTNTQPYELPSCGSVFRNPEPYKAGQLIEELGLKGLCIGGAEVSEKHANFIVNKGNSTAQNINDLINLIQSKIQDSYGLELHTEVKRLGFDLKN